MTDCIFCAIAAKEADADILFEDERFLVFSDINPKAPFHVLVVPKQHLPSLKEAAKDHRELLGDLLLLAARVARDKGLEGYKVQLNVGREGGQEVDHIHLHVVGNKAV